MYFGILYKKETRSKRKNTEIREKKIVYQFKNLSFPTPSLIPAFLNKKVDLAPDLKYLEGFQTYSLLYLLCPLTKPVSAWHHNPLRPPYGTVLPTTRCPKHREDLGKIYT